MTTIQSQGIGSGLDVSGIITKLMAVEQQPLAKLDTKEASFQAEISALGSLQSALASLDTAAAGLKTSYGQTAANKFATLSASVGDGTQASASASSSAVPGSYTLQVTQLAQAQRLTTQPGAFASATAAVPMGNLTLSVGSGAKYTIKIDGTNNTLAGVRDAINAANTGVSATIVTVSATDARLVLTSNTQGTSGMMTLTGIAGLTTGVSTAAGAFATENDVLDQGTVTLTIAGVPHNFTIDGTADHTTLADLKKLINDAGLDVKASIVGVDAGDARLVVTSTKSPAESLTLDSTTAVPGVGITGLTGLTSANGLTDDPVKGGLAAQGAKFKLNGVDIESATNTVSSAITGVTLNLLKEGTSATTLTVTKDTSSALNTSLTALVSAFNDLNKQIHTLGSYDAKTGQAGPLLGNSSLMQIDSVVKGILGGAVPGTSSPYKYLADIGVAIQRDGSLSLDASKLQAAASSNYDAVATLTAAFGKRLSDATKAMLDTKSGTVSSAVNSLNSSISDIGKQRTALKLRLQKVQKNYEQQFAAMDKFVASWNQTSTYLTQQLSALMGSSSGSKSS